MAHRASVEVERSALLEFDEIAATPRIEEERALPWLERSVHRLRLAQPTFPPLGGDGPAERARPARALAFFRQGSGFTPSVTSTVRRPAEELTTSTWTESPGLWVRIRVPS